MNILNSLKDKVITGEANNLHEINKSFIPSKEEFELNRTADIDRKALFQSTVNQLNWDEKDLNQRQNQYAIESRFGYIAMLLCFFLAIQNVTEYQYSIFISQATVTLVFLLHGFSRAFRSWQVEKREFKSFYEFLCDPEGWVR